MRLRRLLLAVMGGVMLLSVASAWVALRPAAVPRDPLPAPIQISGPPIVEPSPESAPAAPPPVIDVPAQPSDVVPPPPLPSEDEDDHDVDDVDDVDGDDDDG